MTVTKISVAPVWARVESYDPDVVALVNTTLSVRDPGAKFLPSVRWGKSDGVVRFMKPGGAFPSGFTWRVARAIVAAGYPRPEIDWGAPPQSTPLAAALTDFSWREYQTRAVDHGFLRRVMSLQAPTRSGKCLGLGTLVLMADGSLVAVEDVKVGDSVKSPDGSRTVTSVTRGRGPLYRVMPNKGDSWVCNDAHVLTLARSGPGGPTWPDVIDIELREYLDKPKSWRVVYKIFQPPPVDFCRKDAALPVDPYFLGLWLSDGRHYLKNVQVATKDPEIIGACHARAAEWGLDVVTYEDRL